MKFQHAATLNTQGINNYPCLAWIVGVVCLLLGVLVRYLNVRVLTEWEEKAIHGHYTVSTNITSL